MRHARLAALALAFVTVTAGVGACSSSGTDGTGAGVQTGSGSIGTAGGAVTSTDGAVTVTIPAGALAATTAITISPIASPGAGSIGQVYDLEPSGTTFANPVTLTISLAAVNGDSGAAADASNLRIATYASGAWSAVASSVGSTSISAQISHFSPWGVIASPTGALGSVSLADGGAGDSFDGSTTNTCAEGAACSSGAGCGFASSGGASTSCTCTNGSYVCTTGASDDGGTGTTTSDSGSSGSTCAQGAACSAGEGCGGASAGGPSYSCTCISGLYDCTSDGGVTR